MATYDFYNYLSNSEIDLTELNLKYDIVYPNIQQSKLNIKNLFSLISISDLSLLDRFLDDYIISADERADQIAYKLYNDINLWWIVLLVNKISSFNLPVSDDTLFYMANAIYENEYKFSLDKYLELLKEENDRKRNIKVIKKEQLTVAMNYIFSKV
jgi:hypothetical protein